MYKERFWLWGSRSKDYMTGVDAKVLGRHLHLVRRGPA